MSEQQSNGATTPEGFMAGEAKEPEVDRPAGADILASGTLTDLANRLDRGIDVIRARAEILATARKAAIKMTSPEDWLLFRDFEGREVGYLQDCGCDRVRDVYGIDVFDVGKPEKVQLNDSEFMYVISGNGRCHLTGQVIEAVEGGRSSTDDFIVTHKPPLKGYEIELAVRKAARSNLDGQICRSLAGLQSVPYEEIAHAFEGDAKKTRARFREGRGYGSGAQRRGATVESEWKGEIPSCSACNTPMKYRPAGQTKAGRDYEPFFACSRFPQCKATLKLREWEEILAQSKPDAESAAQ